MKYLSIFKHMTPLTQLYNKQSQQVLHLIQSKRLKIATCH